MALSPRLVHQKLQRAARRLRWARGARGAISGAAVALAALALFLVTDAYLHYGPAGRWAGFLLTLTPLLVGLAVGWRAWRAPLSEAAVARRIERSCGETGAGNALISAVQFDRELPEDSPLRAALFDEMSDPFPRVVWRDVFDIALLQKLALVLGAATALVFLWALVQPAAFANSAARLFLPTANISPLTRTRIETILPGDARIVNGQSLSVTAVLGGALPDGAWLWWREAGSGWRKALMEHEVGTPVFAGEWKEIRASMEYYVEAGDARSPIHRVVVRPRTALVARSADIEPPAYSQQGKRTVKDAGAGAVPGILPGSRVLLTVEWNHPIAELTAKDDQNLTLSAEQIDPAHWRVTVGQVFANRTVRLDSRDTDGFTDRTVVSLNVKPDAPPQITVTAPAEGRELIAAPESSLLVQLTAADDFGLASLALYRSSDDKPDATLVHEWKDAAGQKSYGGQVALALRDFLPPNAAPDGQRLTFCAVATDGNSVNGPGRVMSRPIVVTLRSADALNQEHAKANEKIKQGLADLIKLQKANLDATRAAAAPDAPLTELLNRQVQIAGIGADLAASADALALEMRSQLASLVQSEMKDAVLALRDAAAATGAARAAPLGRAVGLQAIILARLQGSPASAEDQARQAQVRDMIAGVEELARKQRDLLKETAAAPAPDAVKKLSERQDALSDQAVKVRKNLETQSRNAASGDKDFRARIEKAAGMFGELHVYEDMLAAAEKLGSNAAAPAADLQKGIIANLVRIIAVLNEWQTAQAAARADALRKDVEAIKAKLDKLAEIEKGVIEKSKELARKDQFDPADQAVADEIRDTKDLMAEVVEKMLTDAHIFPDLKPSNELRSELTSIFEDVQQSDKDQAAAGKLKPTEIAVQKEDGLLQAIEQAKKIAEDMEMWLPSANEKEKWLLENFDKSEMPEIPNLPLPDAFEDIVGKLLEEQQNLADEVQDAASNQAFAENEGNGWEIRDGPMPGFGAQGKSGNERPNKNEQMGRSSGGREGMSDGEMVGDTASRLEGSKPDVRRTNDPLQNGSVKDPGGANETRATGGGKAGGYSDRVGMDGNAPLRTTKGQAALSKDALAVRQALLAQKASKVYAAASLLYLKTGAMPDVTRLMGESEAALREGRAKDFATLHRRIVGRLSEVKGQIVSGDAALSLPAGGAARAQDQQILGGSEGTAPARYKDAVADYYRALAGDQK